MTPHIEAKEGEIAKIALLAGDPLRAKKIAEKYLENPKLVSRVRNMLFYTGTHQGIKITVGSHGMGIPSMGIYSYELFKFYDVDYIIRIGSAGSYVKDVNIYDVFSIKKTIGTDDYYHLAGGPNTREVEPDVELYNLLDKVAKKKNLTLKTGTAHCSDVFYNPEGYDPVEEAKKHNYSVVEMESYALFANAKILNKKAAALLTISDSFVSKQATSVEERENHFNETVELAFDAAMEIANNRF